MRGAISLASLVLLLSGCAPKSLGGQAALYGSYAMQGPAMEAVPAVTLKIERSRYTFCRPAGCAAGKWTARPENACDGRITFAGPELEAFARDLATASGPDPVWTQRGLWKEIEMDYNACQARARITLGTGDAAFVKR